MKFKTYIEDVIEEYHELSKQLTCTPYGEERVEIITEMRSILYYLHHQPYQEAQAFVHENQAFYNQVVDQRIR